MDNYFNLERVKQAHGLCEKIIEHNLSRKRGEPKLGSTELILLMVLARKMGRKTDMKTGEIENGCRATLTTLEREAAMERTAIGKGIGKLIDAGLITQTYDRHRTGDLTKEGERRKALGMSLDCPEKNNYQRKPIGAPRKDGSSQGQWKHSVYHLVPAIWDSVVFDSREVPEPAPVSSADQAVIDSIARPVAKKESETAAVSKADADEVFEEIKHYFKDHPTIATQSELDARRSMNAVCVELAKRALDLGNMRYAGDFIGWIIQRRREAYDKLMGGSIKNLGVHFGLPKYIVELWDEFVPQRDDDYDQYGSEEESASDETVPETNEPETEDQDYRYAEPAPVAAVKKAAVPFSGYDEDDNLPAIQTVLTGPFDADLTPNKMFPPAPVAPLVPPQPVKPKYRADLDLKVILGKAPSGQIDATLNLPADHQDEMTAYLIETFGGDCLISGDAVWIAAHLANQFLHEERFVDPYATERTMYDRLVSVVAAQCKQSFAAIITDFVLMKTEDLGITREHYKDWVADRYAEFLNVSDQNYGMDSVYTKVSLRKGIKLPQFAEHLKSNPFASPVPKSATLVEATAPHMTDRVRLHSSPR